MKKKTILVTGGTGYIGSHTVCRLLSAGYHVISIDNLSNSYRDVNDRIAQISGKHPIFYQSDLCDFDMTEQIILGHSDIEGIIHFAALKSVGESVAEPLKYYRNNLTSLTNILEISLKYHIHNFVFSSSCTVYGQPEKLPVSEDTPTTKPMSPYGNTKKISEEILYDFSLVHPESQVISLRYFNPVGADPSGIIGELPIGIPNNLMPYITQTAYGIREKLHIFGGDYNTPDGTAIRDYIHVVDLADAHILALERMMHGRMKESFEIFNLGTGRGFSVLEMLNTFTQVTGVNVPYQIVQRRSGDIEQIWADCSLANNELGWKAGRSIQDMVADAWKWENYYRKTVQNTHSNGI